MDFKELSKDGNDFELLVRELLHNRGLEVYWSGKGPDGGKDLICIEKYSSSFKNTSKKWLVQCKHNAHSGNAVGKSELDSIIDSCGEHNATGYILVCSTYPSSAVVKRLNEIEKNGKISTCFWDSIKLEKELQKPSNWNIVNLFFPKYATQCGWHINTIEPGFWFANYNGNIFYISTRLSADYGPILHNIEERLETIKDLSKSDNEFVRTRAIYFDDNHTNYRIYVDILIPKKGNVKEEYLNCLVENLNFSNTIDGVPYEFDIMTYFYNPSSDSFDVDSVHYYKPYLDIFKYGGSREGTRVYSYYNSESKMELTEEFTNKPFENLVAHFKQLNFLDILNSNNSRIEIIDLFSEDFSWSSFDEDNFFNVAIRFYCNDFEKLTVLLSYFPQNVSEHFELKENYPYYPEEGFRLDKRIYTLEFTVHSSAITSKIQFRHLINIYLLEVSEGINKYLNDYNDSKKE